jgi:hypothetical protein
MSGFNPELKGTLGENLYKKSDSHPDMKGKCQIEGQEYMISGWLKEGKTGPFYSLSFSIKQDKPEPAQVGSKIIKPKAVADVAKDNFHNDEVPF